MALDPPPPRKQEINVEDRSGGRTLLVKAAGTLALLAVGVAIAFGLYREWSPFSWSAVQETDLLVAAGVGLISAALLILWILHSLGKLKFRFSFQTLVSVSIIWIGFGAGLFGPAIFSHEGERIADDRSETIPELQSQISSVIYDLALETLVLPPEFEAFHANRPGPYIASRADDHFYVMLNDPGTMYMVPDSELVTGRVALLLIRSLASPIEVDDYVILSDINPRIQNVRDVQVKGSGLVFTNVELRGDCFVLQVWSADHKDLPLQDAVMTLLWEANSCLSPEMSPESAVNVEQAGGRLVVEPSGNILVSVGDFRLGMSKEGGTYEGRPDALGPLGSYGKILRIKPDGTEEIVSSGHRNPQGLLLHGTQSGRLWSTEHGTAGGGELNLIIDGADYGWPDVTYGVPYGPNLPHGNWEIGKWSNHEGFEKPRLAWLPSVGPSQLVAYEGKEFPEWQGDLLVATMRDESIRRIRLDEDRVMFDERIEIGIRDSSLRRIRDMLVLEDGRLLLSFDSGDLGILSVLSG